MASKNDRHSTPSDSSAVVLRCPDTPALLDATRQIFNEYAASLDVDLCFQDFAAELAGLPGAYAAPGGHLLLAFVDGELAGCGAMRSAADADYANACEMKRLYVRPEFRGYGLGRALAEALLDEGRSAGYSSMLLDTLDDMESARELYAALGFEEIPPYYFNPIPGAHYLKAELAGGPVAPRWSPSRR
ncbi:MAG: GNAT family N-acetyltransferase [Caldimonas sp.]